MSPSGVLISVFSRGEDVASQQKVAAAAATASAKPSTDGSDNERYPFNTVTPQIMKRQGVDCGVVESLKFIILLICDKDCQLVVKHGYQNVFESLG